MTPLRPPDAAPPSGLDDRGALPLILRHVRRIVPLDQAEIEVRAGIQRGNPTELSIRSVAEEKVLLGSLTRLRKQYADSPTAAKELLSVGDSKRHDKLDPAEHAAFTQVCLLIFNLDETLSKE